MQTPRRAERHGREHRIHVPARARRAQSRGAFITAVCCCAANAEKQTTTTQNDYNLNIVHFNDHLLGGLSRLEVFTGQFWLMSLMFDTGFIRDENPDAAHERFVFLSP